MTIDKKIPWWMPQMTGLESDLIKEVIEINYLNEGDYTERLENEIAQLLGSKFAVAVTSGTTALFLSLTGSGVGHGDEVIVPDLTFIATANAVTMTGAKPILVDVDPVTLNISCEAFESAITPWTKAVIPVHISGRGADMPEIKKIADEHGLTVIEDAAEALLSKAHGGYLGTFGKAGCFSFSPNKTITTGQGGLIVTDDEKLFGRLLELKDQGRPQRGTGGDDIHYSVGYNFKLTNLQAAVGIAQLSALQSRVERQKKIYSIYADHLTGLPGITLPGFNIEEGEVPQWTDALVERRNELDNYLAERGVSCRRFWYPLHTQEPYKMDDLTFPDAVRSSSRALWLPSAFTLTDDDVATVCRFIHEFVGE
ncbi:DegT/DnrJ/EryC1/StrS family aminotransferase [Candidatus Latescibacterota bacterium]